jgi:hypothetical protein
MQPLASPQVINAMTRFFAFRLFCVNNNMHTINMLIPISVPVSLPFGLSLISLSDKNPTIIGINIANIPIKPINVAASFTFIPKVLVNNVTPQIDIMVPANEISPVIRYDVKTAGDLITYKNTSFIPVFNT